MSARWAALGAFAVALPATQAGLLLAFGHLNHDIAWLLVATERLVDGGRYFEDILEPTPPVTLVLMAPSLLIRRLLGIGLYPAYLVWVGALVVVATALAVPGLRRALGRAATDPLPEAWLVPAVLCLFPWYGFGQREHLFVILYLPALLLFQAECREPGRAGAAFAVPVLALATLGLLMKPYLLVIPAVQVGAALVQRRRIGRIVALAAATAAAIVVILGGLFWSAVADWLRVARVATEVYDAYDDPLWAPKLVPHAAMIALVWFVHARLLSRGSETDLPVRDTLAAATAALLVVVLQRKAFPYHLLPAIQFTALAAGIVLLRLGRDGLRLRRRGVTARRVALVVCAGMFLQAAPVIYRAFRPHPAEAREFVTLVAPVAAGRTLMALSTSVWPAFPAALEIGARWSGRAPCQWLIPGALQLSAGDADARARGARYAQLARDMLADDVARGRPEVLAVATGPGQQGVAGPFDLLAFLREDARLRAAFDGYRERTRGSFWTVYERIP